MICARAQDASVRAAGGASPAGPPAEALESAHWLAHIASVNPRWPAGVPWTEWHDVCQRRRAWRRVLKAMSEVGPT